jgi:hypothetical protein
VRNTAQRYYDANHLTRAHKPDTGPGWNATDVIASNVLRSSASRDRNQNGDNRSDKSIHEACAAVVCDEEMAIDTLASEGKDSLYHSTAYGPRKLGSH